MEKNNTEKLFKVAGVADTLIEEIKIAIKSNSIKENIDIIKKYDLSVFLGQLIKDALIKDFDDEQIEKIAEDLQHYTTYLVPVFNYQNRERTPRYNKALKQVFDTVSAKLNDQTAKEEFVANETKHGDDFEHVYGISPEKFYDSAKDLFNLMFCGKTSAQSSEKNIEL